MTRGGGRGGADIGRRDLERQREVPHDRDGSMIRDYCVRCARLLPRRYLRDHGGEQHCDVCLHVLGVAQLQFSRVTTDQWDLLIYEAMHVLSVTGDRESGFLLASPAGYSGRPIGTAFTTSEDARRAGVAWVIHRWGGTP